MIIGGFSKTATAVKDLLDSGSFSLSLTIERRNAVHVETQKAITPYIYVTPVSVNMSTTGTREKPIQGRYDVAIWVIEKMSFTSASEKLVREDELMQVVDEAAQIIQDNKTITVDGESHPLTIYSDEPRTPVISAETLDAGLFAGYLIVSIWDF